MPTTERGGAPVSFRNLLISSRGGSERLWPALEMPGRELGAGGPAAADWTIPCEAPGGLTCVSLLEVEKVPKPTLIQKKAD